MGTAILIAILVVAALAFLLRQPLAELRSRRRIRAQERKREWRRRRDEEKARRSVERAMNPARAAARKGEPKWQKVAERHGSKCWLCGTRTYSDDCRRIDAGQVRLGATYPTVDYLVAIDQGGTYEMDNLRIAHRHCKQRHAAQGLEVKYGSPKRTFPPSAS